MKKTLALGILLVLGSVTGTRLGSMASAAPPQAAEEGKGCSAPKAWGQVKGVSDRSIAFQDSSGTIRVLDLGPCMRGQTQLIVKISRP
jgi:hypothetical protein